MAWKPLPGGQKQFAYPKHSSYNAREVRHQRQSSPPVSAKSGSPAALKAVHQQRSKQQFARNRQPRSFHPSLASSMSRRPANRNCQAAAKSPTPESIRTLNTEALRLHLNRHNLVTTGKRQELVERLLQWYAASHQDAKSSSQEDGSESGSTPDSTRKPG